ncbi:MAG TPA: tail fiber protein [Baekduia sp.]|jgi:microcystin-dependent protein
MEPYIGELRLLAFGFEPEGWVSCNGQFLAIATNQPLFALLGTRFGGDGQATFALPDLRGRIPIHNSPGLPIGTPRGEESHTLTTNELPTHLHQLHASTAVADTAVPTGAVPAVANNGFAAPTQPQTAVAAATVVAQGNGVPHENRQPYLVLNWCIAIDGQFPEAS